MPRPGAAREVSHWPRIRQLVRPHRARLAGMTAVAFLGGAAEAALLVMVTRMGLAIADGRDETGLLLGWTVTMGEAIAIAATLVGLRLGLSLVGSSLSTGLTALVRSSMRRQLADAYLHSSWSTQQSEPSGRLSQLLTAFANEAAASVTALGQTLTASLNLTALVLGALLVDPVATLVVVVALLVLGSILAPLRRRLRLRARAAAASQLAFASSVAELGSLGLEMQTFGAREQFSARIDELIATDVRARRRSDLLRSVLPSIYTSLAYGALLGGLAAAGLAGVGKLSSLGAVMLVMLRSLSYGQGLQVASASMMQSLPFLEQLDDTLARYRAAPASGGSEVPDRVGAVEAVDVSFGYDEGRPVLESVSFAIEPGETIGVIGPSGAGKSTLVQLLLGVRDPTSGSVRVGGVDLRDVDRTWWTTKVAYVAQDALLFTGTVAENLRFFREGIDGAALRRACEQAHVLAEVEALPEGFDTHLGERGSQLSGGQRQRLSIARALVGAPQVLVLDEPTSALDARSEALIRQTLAELHGDATVVIIAHRMSTLEMCDRLLVVDGGRLVAAGRPDELRDGNEFYRHALELSGLT